MRSYFLILLVGLCGISETIYGAVVTPTRAPTQPPTFKPTLYPTSKPPTWKPTYKPTKYPSGQPTSRPSRQPINRPSHKPSRQPTSQPTKQPINRPTGILSNQIIQFNSHFLLPSSLRHFAHSFLNDHFSFRSFPSQ